MLDADDLRAAFPQAPVDLGCVYTFFEGVVRYTFFEGVIAISLFACTPMVL
jgi:hypothetical protein